MTSRISHTTVNARDPYGQARFWGAVLGMAEDPQDPNQPDHEECMIFSPDGRTRLLFIAVPDAKQVRNRVHLDLAPTDRTRDEEIDRVLALGATEVDDRRLDDGRGWMVLADPEGNEFCVLRGGRERTDPYAHLVTGAVA
ncbi:catechol 2,3-dioxygenase-like lactoylglutathione lyase family enzyme [Friedmanniella endophytica]|uniref:Catechol 2,3-dioxygenase-like lactoylglutathione lyase family enzyme n=1 Tax=Microlunatus kandeliicorticis TaxID=1759536 RepID=A0A7W3IPG6_9ACTN|nr:VOC family protein [Microlunatus kandeliicorticis]MBA8792828.1 catechol 2,3-dioxygenase-like lactoylglutathione lyase family enzyme [Microlunatus kandeliicorticis]